jgi:hypothetical protein
MCLVGDKMPCQTNYLWTRRISNLPTHLTYKIQQQRVNKVPTKNACKGKWTNKLSKETMNAMETRTSSLRKANKL